MTDSGVGFDVPVEPVWYEASATGELIAPPVAAPTPVDLSATAETPAVDDILPAVEAAQASAPPVYEELSDEPKAPAPPRQWRTVYLIFAIALALLIGFVIGRVTDSSGGASSPNAQATGSSAKAPTSESQPSASVPQPQSSTDATGETATSAPTAVNGHAVLLNIPRHTGPLITDHFTVTGSRWVLGWAYDCTGQQAGTGAFNITVFDGTGGPSKDGGIDQQGAKGSSVVAYTSTGERYLSVTTNCVWAIRVTT